MTIKGARYLLAFCVLAWFIQGELLGQQKDFQSWWEFNIDKGLRNGLDLSGEIEQRFRNNSLQYDRSLITLAGEFGINDYLNVGAGLRAILASNRELQLNTKYRIHAEATGGNIFSGFDLSFRIRFQYGFEDLFDPAFKGGNKFGNRYRVKVARHIFGTRLGWFGSVESWTLLNNQSNSLFYKIRYSAGGEFNLNFRSKLNFRYILEDEFHMTNPIQSHILLFGYSYRL